MFLDWEADPVAKWLTANEIDRAVIKWSCTVNWKELNCDVLIAVTCPSAAKPYTTDNQDLISSYRNVPYLKSHLQKCIRRSNSYKAIKTAMHLYHLDCAELLRRLSIIAVEDALPVKGYSTLMLLTAAVSHGYNLSEEHVCWIMGYIHTLCSLRYYEQIPTFAETEVSLKTLKLRSLSPEGRNLCYSLVFRNAYGGMKGDRAMLMSAAKLWATRYRVSSEFIKLLDTPCVFISLPTEELKPHEWILAAVDFHCYPGVLLNLSERHDEFTTEDIKEALWHCSSSLTNKGNIADDLKQRDKDSSRHIQVWSIIKKNYLSLAKFMIGRM
jgi:hypothetical protein